MNNILKKISKSLTIAALSLLIAFPVLNVRAETTEEDAVKNTVQTFFDSIAEKSAEKAQSVLYKEGFLFSIKDSDNNVAVTTTAIQDFIVKLPTFTGDLLEKMENPKILIHKKIATVWTPYTFHRDGKYSHRGIDSIQMIHTNEGWKICGILYTVESE